MAPKTSDGEVNDGSSRDPEVTEPMETSTGVVLSLLGKRKAETNESGESDFEGREDDSANLREYSDKEFEEQCRHYKRKLIETKGFFETSDKFPPYVYSGVASLGDLDQPAMLGLTIREEKNVKMEHILRANYNPGSMTKFYITFAAREFESPDAPLVEYQAKAVWSVTHKIYPILCRPSPAPTRINILAAEISFGFHLFDPQLLICCFLVEGHGRDHLKEVAKVMEESGRDQLKSFTGKLVYPVVMLLVDLGYWEL
ncbi:hypothetical protein ARALYDRAFT_920513 [Arabidopsis lyrata subsp. lyrata]|uniref:Cystatin domain-containing protein n=1 Tax=Arabidopsis lyrata subsp. lyrata TaxID=81972 RepID=D7MX88_ARALL|nr:hypothetical protein ARALYDRAFT_920513 [Arabidopsis lyrata subsp. lyrata]